MTVIASPNGKRMKFDHYTPPLAPYLFRNAEMQEEHYSRLNSRNGSNHSDEHEEMYPLLKTHEQNPSD